MVRSGNRRWEVNKVTYKTPDYMLCSAQDYHPGEARIPAAHLAGDAWAPTPWSSSLIRRCISEEGSHRPNFWHGNVILPRVAQWKDVLIAVHKLPDDDWMGFTHAYFPLYAFDEHALRDGWAFARKGDGYLALTAAQGLTPITRGDNAYRELRSYGTQNIWLCHMGRAARDGSFDEFQRAMLELDAALRRPVAANCAHAARRDAGLRLGRAAAGERSRNADRRLQALREYVLRRRSARVADGAAPGR